MHCWFNLPKIKSQFIFSKTKFSKKKLHGAHESMFSPVVVPMSSSLWFFLSFFLSFLFICICICIIFSSFCKFSVMINQNKKISSFYIFPFFFSFFFSSIFHRHRHQHSLFFLNTNFCIEKQWIDDNKVETNFCKILNLYNY